MCIVYIQLFYRFSLTENGIVLAKKLPTFDLNCVEISRVKCISVEDSQLQNRGTFSEIMSTSEARKDHAQEVTRIAINKETSVRRVELEETETAQEKCEYLINSFWGETCTSTVASSSRKSNDNLRESHSELKLSQPNIKYNKVNNFIII